MKKLFWLLLTVVVYLPSANAADKIRMGVPELNAQFLPLALAEKRSFFQEEGLQVEIFRINPTVALAALVSGELNYRTVIGNSVAAVIQGAPLRVLACYVPAPPARSSPALISNPFRNLEVRQSVSTLSAAPSNPWQG